MAEKPFTKKQIIGHLNKLSLRWNDKYWIYVSEGTVHLMKKDKNGKTIESPDGGVEQEAIIDSFGGIDADGGGW
jgi:hypothetical protein